MIVAGLTGNYGMGKSSVTAIFRQLGAHTLDTDKIVAELLKQESVRSRIMGLLGTGVLRADGSLNKQAIAEVVFRSKTLRKRLEQLLHPLVMDQVDSAIRRIRDAESVVVVEVPLLFEGRYEGRFDRTITVYTNQLTALARLKQAGISRKDALLRMKAQMDVRLKKRLSDFCINNNGTKRQMEKQVREVFQALVNDNMLKLTGDRHRS